ncbi:DUF917 domain-containing protein [Prescottella agglutinans]|uniref:DUF917 family protein n=1 Tax=Prescottella agglutinans TaxID=1644129 RepID=A0ABT6MG60_9NOCA|nr:DUF917 domain-containing protein [Prescottella agglutinans]MDH6283309.1 DUF917 family protein [Prescottella agglutinans]
MTTSTSQASRLTTLTSADIPHLTTGAAVLGCGGGGGPYVGGLIAQRAIDEYGPVQLTQLSDLPDDALVIPVEAIGAPTVSLEKLHDVECLLRVIEKIAEHHGRPPTHISPVEIGGVNSTLPIAAASRLGLPLVDGDGIGRAFPELQMCLPNLFDVPASPISLADETGNAVLVDATSAAWAERLARSIAVEMGCSAALSMYSMTGRQARQCLVEGTLSLAVSIGCTIAEARAGSGDPCQALANTLGGMIVHRGKVTDVSRRTEGGFARGQALIEGTDPHAPSNVTLHFQNEHLLAMRDGVVITTTPDMIVVVDDVTAEPITTENLRYGQRVRVLTAPCDPRWHTSEGLDIVGPTYFGYDTPVRRWDGTAVAAEHPSQWIAES